MIKLLICLVSGAALAIAVLQLRQQNLEIGYQNAELHRQIRSHQAKLWDQQLQIATFTAPNAIENVVKTHELNLVPRLNSTTRPATPPATRPTKSSTTAAKPTAPQGKPTTPARSGGTASVR